MKIFALLGLALLATAQSAFEQELQSKLSPGGSLSSTAPPRWNLFGAPVPRTVVNVATEQDVANSILAANKYRLPFVAQSGGHGWATTFNLGSNGVLINMRGLKQFTLSADKRQATIGGGALIRNTISDAFNKGVQLMTGNCNCVGTLGAILGGGYGNLMGLHGFGVDQVLSMRVVTPSGQVKDVSARSDPDLFWAMRGAGPNFGIVTSAVVKSYPVTAAQQNAWTAQIFFAEDKLERLVAAIDKLRFAAESNIFMYFLSGGPPTNQPVILVTLFVYNGDEATGRRIFKSIFDVGPTTVQHQIIPYNQWNDGSDSFCAAGSRKPSFGVGFQRMVPAAWRAAWNAYTEFQRQPGAENSGIILEAYNLAKARSVSTSSASFPHRGVNYNAVAIAWYENPALDTAALRFGKAVRAAIRSTDGLEQDATYINFAHGDESLPEVYGSSLPRLFALKKRVDPQNRFNQWFPIR